MKRLFRLVALAAPPASSLSLLVVLAACGNGDGGSPAESQLRTVRATEICHEIVLCIQGAHWDSVLCKCVPNEDDAGTETDAAADAGSVTPDSASDASDEDDSSCPGH